MKKLILFILIPFFIACSDDDSNNNNAGSFLDEYNGVIWLDDANDENYEFWWIFTPDGVTDGERYYDDCDTWYIEWGELNDDYSVDVVENTSNRLEIMIIDYVTDTNGNPITHSKSMTFTVSSDGNTLTATYNDGTGDTETYSRSDNSPC